MYKEGEVVMRNVGYNKQVSLSFGSFYVNRTLDVSEGLFSTLEGQMNRFVDVLELSLKKVKDAVLRMFQENLFVGGDKSEAITSAINQTENTLLEIKHNLLLTVGQDLKRKRLDFDSFQRLNNVLNIQTETALEFFINEDVTFENVFELLNFLNEIPCYLVFDLDVSSLPSLPNKFKKDVQTESYHEKLFYHQEYPIKEAV